MDGEGSFSIQVNVRKDKHGNKSPNFGPRMSMGLKQDREGKALRRLQERFGGNIYTVKDGTFKWYLGTRAELEIAANALKPFLDIKAEPCERFLEALSYFPTTRKAHAKGERSWTPEMTRKVARIALTLNPDGKPKTKTLEYLKELDAIYSQVDAVIGAT